MRLLIAKLAATSVRSVSFALNNDEDIAELATDLDSCVRLLREAEYDLVVLMVSEGQTRARDAIAHIRAEVGRVPMVVLTEPGGGNDTVAAAPHAVFDAPETTRARDRSSPVVPHMMIEPPDGRGARQPAFRDSGFREAAYQAGDVHQGAADPAPRNGQDRTVPWRWVTQGSAETAPRRRGPAAAIRQGASPLGSLRGVIAFSGGWDGLRVDGSVVPLSQAELRIFAAIWRARGASVSSEELLEAVYGEQERPASRVLPVFLFKLRRKLAAVGVGDAIETEIGRGVRLRADAVPDEPAGASGEAARVTDEHSVDDRDGSQRDGSQRDGTPS